jgi:SAM-dependent methyltransferase
MDDLNLKLKDSWSNAHKSETFTSRLSGCEYDETINFLKLNDYIKSGLCVLEIGVGYGFVTKGLYDNGIKVSAVDISEVGLERVKNYCENVYIVDEINKLPSDYFDIIICNNVIQHVPTLILLDELKEFMRSLKKDGIFAIQFISSDKFYDNGINATHDDAFCGRLCRTVECMESMFQLFDGKCKMVYGVQLVNLYPTGCHVFHVKKYN